LEFPTEPGEDGALSIHCLKDFEMMGMSECKRIDCSRWEVAGEIEAASQLQVTQASEGDRVRPSTAPATERQGIDFQHQM
jgi:hypothetical protein